MVIKVLNLDKCIKKLDKIGKVDMKSFIQVATQLVQRTAKVLAPYKTGYLKRSIKRETIKKGTGVIGRVYTVTEYAPYQEFGTSKMNPHPFMFPALQRHRVNIQKSAKKYIVKNINKLKR